VKWVSSMRSGGIAFAPPPKGSAVRAPLLVCERPESALPRWASAWCDQARLGIFRRPTLPSPAVQSCPGAAGEWARVMSDVCTTTAAGGTVLINRPSRREPGPPRVVAAVQEVPGDQTVLLDAAACADALPAELALVHCVPISFGERSVGLEAAVDRGRAVLEECLRLLGQLDHRTRASARLERANPHELVNEELDADLLVIGGSRVGPSRELGLVAVSAVRHAPCPVLVVPRRPVPKG
jgi:nucleotide-binding universal stress UspA family protein